MKHHHLPMPVGATPDPIDRELEPLLREPIASVWAGAAADPPRLRGALRGRLLERLAASRAEAGVMFTARRSRLPGTELAPGVQARTLYAASAIATTAAARGLRAGEPLRARLIELSPGGRWAGPATDTHREWLVLQGSAQIGRERVQLRDYHVAPMGSAGHALHSAEGALLFLRESATPAAPDATPLTVRDAQAGWRDYAPGIQRRLLWQYAGQAAMLYFAQPGATVPRHTHGHDEECLMVQGELFLDDVLLQAGDYQLAPAGSAHRLTQTDTGAVIYAHGDVDLKFVV